MLWDLFCRVVDNYGDIGVCWRLAAQLAARGQSVRLWTDDASALDWMAPDRLRTRPLVQVLPWPGADVEAAALPEPGEVVIEAFGCDPPPAFVTRMAALRGHARGAPRWINLEYLSAEPHVERSHRLPSPQLAGPGAGLVKHFFYPGFTPGSGGLLREDDLMQRIAAFEAADWLRAQGVERGPGERIVSLFCYPSAPVASLVEQLAADELHPTLLLATAGAASAAVSAVLGSRSRHGALRVHPLPWLSQADFDHLLWSCELNFVRGEDSVVRAQWAARPFVWQLYPQSDRADIPKRDAFLAHHLAEGFLPSATSAPCPPEPASADARRSIRHWWRCWNDAETPLPALPADLAEWRRQAEGWRARLLAQSDLATRLQAFVREAD